MKPISILGAVALLCLALPLPASQTRPWMDARLPADQRAELLLGQMSTEEKLQLIRSRFGMDSDKGQQPEGALGSAGFVAGIGRLGIPAQQLVDAGLGVTNPGAIRKGDHATAMRLLMACHASTRFRHRKAKRDNGQRCAARTPRSSSHQPETLTTTRFESHCPISAHTAAT